MHTAPARRVVALSRRRIAHDPAFICSIPLHSFLFFTAPALASTRHSAPDCRAAFRTQRSLRGYYPRCAPVRTQTKFSAPFSSHHYCVTNQDWIDTSQPGGSLTPADFLPARRSGGFRQPCQSNKNTSISCCIRRAKRNLMWIRDGKAESRQGKAEVPVAALD
jgi:hypothetical protein